MKAVLEKIPLAAGESFSCREFRVPRFAMPWHFHPESELTLIVRGRGTRYVGDSIERFEDGDLVLLGRNLPHYWWKDAADRRSAHSVVLQFDIGFEKGALFDLDEASAVRRLLVSAQRGLAFSGDARDEAMEALMRLRLLSGWRRLCGLLEILGLLAEQPHPRQLSSASFAPELREQDAGRLAAVCRYVNEGFAGPIRHKTAAGMAGLSPAAFSRFFHKRMGRTFEAYVVEIRIGHACRLLRERDARVLETALVSGFNNLSNFNRHFLRVKGITPRSYRRLAGQDPA